MKFDLSDAPKMTSLWRWDTSALIYAAKEKEKEIEKWRKLLSLNQQDKEDSARYSDYNIDLSIGKKVKEESVVSEVEIEEIIVEELSEIYVPSSMERGE